MKTGLRILFITSSDPEKIGGGALNYAKGILSALSSHYSVDVLVADPRRHNRDWKLPNGLPYRHVHPNYFKFRNDFIGLPALIKKCASKLRIKTKPAAHPAPYEMPQDMKDVVKRWSKENQYDVIVVNYFWMTPAFEYFSDALKVTLTHDVWHHHVSVGKSNHQLLKKLTHETEASYLNQCDLLIAISEHDAEIFRRFTSVKEVIVSLPAFKSSNHQKKEPKYGCLIFASGYQPNIEGLNWFLTEVWPTVLKQSESAQLSIGGQICRALEANSQALPPNSQLIGGCWDPADFYQHAQMAVVPLLNGTGVKTKIIEAMQFGLPIVTTPQGLLGIEFLQDYGVAAESDPQRFAEAIVDCINRPEDAEKRGKANRGAFEKYFTLEAANEALIKRLKRANLK